jgi:hypothetical protein
MKCENYWSWKETGGVLRRLWARWHASRCPGCRESLATLEAIRRELAPAESPSPAHDRLWERAMAAELPYPSSPKYRMAIVAALGMAALVALAVGAWMAGLRPSHEPPPVVRPDNRPFKPEPLPDEQPTVARRSDDESLRRIDEMKSSLLALCEELEQLSRSASLLEERKQVGQLLSDYEQM